MFCQDFCGENLKTNSVFGLVFLEWIGQALNVERIFMANKMTYSELVKRVSRPGAVMVGLSTLTDAKARKTGNTIGTIFKQSRGVGIVGADYENAVRREGERQGANEAAEFKAESRPWGEWLVPSKVATHKGRLYLRTQSAPRQRKVSPWKVRAYRDASGKFLSPDAVKPFLPEKTDSARQTEVGLQAKIEVREFAFDSIQKVRIDGKTFELVAD